MNVKILKSRITNKNNSTAIRRTVLCPQLVGLTVPVSSETYFIKALYYFLRHVINRFMARYNNGSGFKV